jgi:outer membrane protein, multidrug efflux system
LGHDAMTRTALYRRGSALTGAVTIAALLAGCVQGPDYQKPTVEVPSSYRYADPAATPVVDTAWWNEFGDPTLDALIRECLANNRDLRIATARVDEFAAVLAGTRSQAYPQIGYGLSGTRQRASERGNIPVLGDPHSTSLSALLSASWEIDLWGRIKRETEAARANLLATEEARRGVILTLISSVAISYITLLDLDEQMRVTNATIESRSKNVGIFEKRLSGGWISEFEMSQVRGEYEAAVAQLPPLQQAIAIQEHALSVLLGRNPGPITKASKLAELHAPTIPAGLPSELLVRRPDIMAAEQQLIASNALIGAARALFFPRINLTAVFGFASAALGDLFTGPARTWSFTGDVAGPIYTGGGLTAAVDQAEARREQSFANYELIIQNAFRDVEDALADVRNSRELQTTLERRVATLQRGLELANYRYENGYSDYLEVLDTERSLFSAELQLASARGNYHRAIVNLYRALGGDWTNAGYITQPATSGQHDGNGQ